MNSPGRHRIPDATRLSRRHLLATGLAGLAAGMPPSRHAASFDQASTGEGPGTWRTWLLVSGDELRPASPPPVLAAEIDELVVFQRDRTVETSATVAKWASGPALLPWTGILLDLIRRHQPSPVRAARGLGLLHMALHDAVVATWDARAAYPRAAPWVTNHALVPLGPSDVSESSFPSEHAAIAAAAVPVLTYLFPQESADKLTALADEAATSRLWAGTNVRSDVEAGLAIGEVVGALAVARGDADGSAAHREGMNRPTGAGYWEPTPPAYVQQPLDPSAGTWTTQVVGSVAQYRSPPPPGYRSPAWEAELGAVRDAVARRTPEQEAAVLSWAGGPGTVTPGGLWIEIARDLALRYGLDLPHVARVLALTSVAIADAFICCWDAKYTYWTARPITADPTLEVMIPTPPFPSYPSGHATASAAATTVLGHLFPDEEPLLAAQSAEAMNSRVWAGIHFPIDSDMGVVSGNMVGRLVVERARHDGAESGPL